MSAPEGKRKSQDVIFIYETFFRNQFLQSLAMTKPKKNDSGTFTSVFRSIAKNNTTSKVCIPITGHGISVKGDGDFSTVIIKCTPLNPLLYDVRQHLCRLVCSESPKWFGKEMSSDVVEEYYTDPLIFDKSIGNVIRLKCTYDPDLERVVQKPFNAMLYFERLRFYKCKFVLEFSLKEIDIIPQILPINEPNPIDHEQEPFPYFEDIESMKKDILHRVRKDIKKISWYRDMLIAGITSIESESDPRKILAETEKMSEFLDVMPKL